MTHEAGSTELHELDPAEFRRQVHSFEHWLGAVEGYLVGTEHGHLPGLRGAPETPADRERLINILCSYAVAENAALEASSGLVRIAPNPEAKLFLATQVMDEGRHVEVMLQRLGELGVADPLAEVERRAPESLRRFAERLLQLVDAHDWDSAIFAQNVVLEAMEFSVFRAHARTADPVTRDMLERVLRDERRHIGFGENELGRRLAADGRRRSWLGAVKTELDALVLETFDGVLGELQVPRSERPDLGRDYLQAVERLRI
jgi:hypothetical protein